MAARKRVFGESYEEYKLNLKEEEKLVRNHLEGKYISIAGTVLSEPFPVSFFRGQNGTS